MQQTVTKLAKLDAQSMTVQARQEPMKVFQTS